jgi:hypothetical protein
VADRAEGPGLIRCLCCRRKWTRYELLARSLPGAGRVRAGRGERSWQDNLYMRTAMVFGEDDLVNLHMHANIPTAVNLRRKLAVEFRDKNQENCGRFARSAEARH